MLKSRKSGLFFWYSQRRKGNDKRSKCRVHRKTRHRRQHHDRCLELHRSPAHDHQRPGAGGHRWLQEGTDSVAAPATRAPQGPEPHGSRCSRRDETGDGLRITAVQKAGNVEQPELFPAHGTVPGRPSVSHQAEAEGGDSSLPAAARWPLLNGCGSADLRCAQR